MQSGRNSHSCCLAFVALYRLEHTYSAAVKKRCRMHGGALGSGAPVGNQNALKTGRFTRQAIAERKRLRHEYLEMRAHLRGFE